MGNLQAYDIVILILVGWLTLRGAMKGMVSQLAAIAAVLVSFWAAVRFGPVLEPVMQSNFNAQPPWNKVLALTVAFVGASIAVMFLHRIVARIICLIRMRKFDRLCGALFGFLKGVLIGMILTFFAVMLSEQTRELATQSRSGKIFVRLIQRSQSLLPKDVSTLIETNLEGFMKQIDSGTEIASKTAEQARTTSTMIEKAKNATELIQTGLTHFSERFYGERDPADDPPALLSEIQKGDDSAVRDHPMPKLSDLYKTNFGSDDNLQNVSSTLENATTQVTPAIPASNFRFQERVPNANSEAPASPSSVIAPSADLLPMTSTTTPPLPTGTDWRTLMREMK